MFQAENFENTCSNSFCLRKKQTLFIWNEVNFVGSELLCSRHGRYQTITDFIAFSFSPMWRTPCHLGQFIAPCPLSLARWLNKTNPCDYCIISKRQITLCLAFGLMTFQTLTSNNIIQVVIERIQLIK